MQIYFSEVPLHEGFDILSLECKHDRLVRGRRINRPSGWNLFSRMEGQAIKCWCCGVEADRWVATKGPSDLVGHPDLNLYASGPDGVVLMTRDHIIPKSLGGVDDWRNMRPGCSFCNERRGNEVNLEDIRFARDHPELISEERIIRGKKSLQEAVQRLSRNGNLEEIARLMKPFIAMGYL